MSNYTHVLDLAQEVEPPEDGILTRTLFNDDDVKAVIFGFGTRPGVVRTHGIDASHSAFRKRRGHVDAWVMMRSKHRLALGSTCLRI